ncbi:LOW QUALITY PROTEIN: thyroid hormone receptor-associated protein 3 [Salmo salar]|uniref:LOW QUALITY PROTEIN: thyroid hormone receptor-associated protein 3 n=1 Tax=Salmo salar TaxID=8030 RepID=A0A1S3Q2D0_SALSA|nr:LOW QUALITY PROTEIN: thyroid hormone receptor-associated protein 3 [Salmo salar]
MSKAPDCPARTRSRSKSRSRSCTRSHSRSRSRSRKHRYRSRSRSRSHSPSHGRNYPTRDYQNNRGYQRGYNRGFRRPFYFRGRTRGFYPRHGYQRGGNSYGYRANNWQGGGYRDGPPQDQDHHGPHSPRRGRSRSRTPRKRSGSRSHSRSRYSDRSSSRGSRRSRRRHSSSSRSSSPRNRRSSPGSGKPGSKDVKDKTTPAEAKEERGGAGEQAGGEGSSHDKASAGKWQGLSDYNTSPKRSSPAVGAKQGKSDSKGSLWRTMGSTGSVPSTKSPPDSTKAGPTASTSGFGFFGKEDPTRADDKTAISSAFKKFLAENKNKKQQQAAAEWENGQDGDGREKGNSKIGGGLFNITAASFSSKTDKSLPFLERAQEAFLKSQAAEREEEEVVKPKGATLTTRDVFGKWEDEPHYYPPGKDEERRRDMAEDVDEELEHMEEELYRSRKQASKKEEKSKRKEKKKEKEKSSRRSPSPVSAAVPPRGSGSGEDRPLALFPINRLESHLPRPSGKREGLEHSINTFDEMPSSSGSLTKERGMSRDLVHPSKKDPGQFRSIFQHIQAAQLQRSPSELFAQHIVTIVHYIKAQHFPSSGMTLSERFAMYQRKAAEMELIKQRKSPEIHRRIDVSPSAFTRHSHLLEELEDCSYKDRGRTAKTDPMDLRLDIERRKRFSGKEPGQQQRDGGKGSQGPSQERSSEKSSKRHKKSKKKKKNRDRSPSSSSSSSSPSPFRGKDHMMGEEMEHMDQGYSKPRFGSRDYEGPMDRGPPRDYEGPMDRGPPRDYEGPMDRGPPRDYEGHMDRGRGRGNGGGFLPRLRGGGRGWNRGNYQGNTSSNGNPPPSMNTAPPERPPDEDWDPEYTPKSRKYYFHDDREDEKPWLESCGRGVFPHSRGRFIYRKGGRSPNKWTHDMFQTGEEGGGNKEEEHHTEMDQKDDNQAAVDPSASSKLVED